MQGPPTPTREGRDLFRAFTLMRSLGHLPKAGGFLNQSAKFLRVVEYCEAVHGAYLMRAAARDEEKKKNLDFLAKVMRDANS